MGNGTADDTAALQRTFDHATPGSTVVLARGKTYRFTSVLHIRTPHLRITGGGTLLATNQVLSSVWLQANSVRLDHVTVRTVDVTQRWTAWEQMGVRIFGHRGISLRHVTVEGSAAAGIYVGNRATHFLLDHVRVLHTHADGIHITMGSNHGVVRDATTRWTGDDGIAVVSYRADGVECRHISVVNPVVDGTTYGRGLSVVGGRNVVERHVTVRRTSAAGIYVAAEGAPWFTYAARNVRVTGGTVSRANWNATVDHGGVLVASTDPVLAPQNVKISHVTVRDTRPTATRSFGVVTTGAVPKNIVFRNLRVIGGPPLAYEGNVARSCFRALHILVNGRLLSGL